MDYVPGRNGWSSRVSRVTVRAGAYIWGLLLNWWWCACMEASTAVANSDACALTIGSPALCCCAVSTCFFLSLLLLATAKRRVHWAPRQVACANRHVHAYVARTEAAGDAREIAAVRWRHPAPLAFCAGLMGSQVASAFVHMAHTAAAAAKRAPRRTRAAACACTRKPLSGLLAYS